MTTINSRVFSENPIHYLNLAVREKLIVKRNRRFFQIVDLGETIPELDDSLMTKEEMFAKIDQGIEEYKQGKTKTLSSKEEIHNFLGLL